MRMLTSGLIFCFGCAQPSQPPAAPGLRSQTAPTNQPLSEDQMPRADREPPAEQKRASDPSQPADLHTVSPDCEGCSQCSDERFEEPDGRVHSCCRWVDFDCTEDEGGCAICAMPEPCAPHCCSS